MGSLERIQNFVRIRRDEVDEIARARVKMAILSARAEIGPMTLLQKMPLSQKAKCQELWAILYKNYYIFSLCSALLGLFLRPKLECLQKSLHFLKFLVKKYKSRTALARQPGFWSKRDDGSRRPSTME
jgi:hypothetical protein